MTDLTPAEIAWHEAALRRKAERDRRNYRTDRLIMTPEAFAAKWPEPPEGAE